MGLVQKQIKNLSNSTTFLLDSQGYRYGIRWADLSTWLFNTNTVNITTLTTSSLTEGSAGAGITINSPVINKRTGAAINVTATATVPQIVGGLITSTSAAAVSITTPTASEIAAVIGAVQGTTLDFIVDNSAGANTVTVIAGSGITVNTPAITGGATLTVSTANTVGIFRLVFTSATAAKILRIA